MGCIVFFRHLKLELLTQFPASNDEKISLFFLNRHLINCVIWLIERPPLNYIIHFQWHNIWLKSCLKPYISGCSRTRVNLYRELCWCSALPVISSISKIISFTEKSYWVIYITHRFKFQSCMLFIHRFYMMNNMVWHLMLWLCKEKLKCTSGLNMRVKGKLQVTMVTANCKKCKYVIIIAPTNTLDFKRKERKNVVIITFTFNNMVIHYTSV